MSSISHLPNIQPKNNDTRQTRRRVNGIVDTLNQSVGSIATNTGDIGTLNTSINTTNANVATKAPINDPTFTGTVTQPDPSVLTAATTTTSATAGTASPLPALPAGYLTVSINGTNYKMPYYNP